LLTGSRLFWVSVSVAIPIMLTLIQLLDDYRYQLNIYRGTIPESIWSSFFDSIAIVIFVLPLGIWCGSILGGKLRSYFPNKRVQD
jgi:hypothetical protein